MPSGKLTNLGLGPYPTVTLKRAREKALENRRAVEEGRDPRTNADMSGIPTFEAAAEKVIAIHRTGWKNQERIAGQWRQSLRDYAYPRIGTKLVSGITTADVLAVLTPIWHAKPAVAKQVRQRIGAVMKWAVAKGYRADNPAGDAITAALPRQNGGTKHHEAIPHKKAAEAIESVRSASKRDPAARLAFEFLALTACRLNEVLGATWEEVDLETTVWTIPAQRMKTKREHRVPLSDRALEVLFDSRKLSPHSDIVFPSTTTGRAVSGRSLQALGRMVSGTPHGWRSTFRSWAADQGVVREVAEAALAHQVKGVEGAYQRSDLFNRRREVMEAWASYIAPSS